MWNVPSIGAGRVSSAVVVGPGSKRLVEMDDVEGLVAHRPDRAELGRRVGGHRRDRAVGRGRKAESERRHSGVGRRTVAGGEHAHGMPLAPQSTGETEHLGLYPAGHGQAVRADHADPHQPGSSTRARRCAGMGSPSAS